MRQIANYSLWIGNIGDLRDVRKIMDAEIQAVIELADNEQLAVLPRELIRLRFPLSDGGDNATWLLRMAAESVENLLNHQISTLICCSAGMNRSVCVASAGLALFERRPFREVLLEVAANGPADVSPRLILQFREMVEDTQL